jgi:hypothetical protein
VLGHNEIGAAPSCSTASHDQCYNTTVVRLCHAHHSAEKIGHCGNGHLTGSCRKTCESLPAAPFCDEHGGDKKNTNYSTSLARPSSPVLLCQNTAVTKIPP